MTNGFLKTWGEDKISPPTSTDCNRMFKVCSIMNEVLKRAFFQFLQKKLSQEMALASLVTNLYIKLYIFLHIFLKFKKLKSLPKMGGGKLKK